MNTLINGSLSLRIPLVLLCCVVGSQTALGASVSFLVDPATIDTSPTDGFITGTEFSPVGDDGTPFILEPVDNLVGADRFLLSDTRGIHFGGGGGSTLAFDFTPGRKIHLTSYTLASTGFFLGNPLFNISQDGDVLSAGNTAVASGDTHAFEGGPLILESGASYRFETTVFGAGIQSFMASWEYTAVPLPGALWLFAPAIFALGLRRQRSGV